MEEAAVGSYCNGYLLSLWISFPAYSASTRTTICGFTKCRSNHHSIISHSYALIKELTSHQIKYNNGPYGIEMEKPCFLKAKKKIFKGLKGRGQFTAYRLGIPEFTEEGFG